MIIIACVDDNMGMLFNHRRQSTDRILRKKIIEFVNNAKLYMNTYSFGQFEKDYSNRITVADDFLSLASAGDFCFVETEMLKAYEKKIEKLILYKWNRIYPSDLKLDILIENWKLISSEDFTGYSHVKITQAAYDHVVC